MGTYEAREKALIDHAAKFAHARNEGKKDGIQEGVQQGKIQMNKGMHELGVPIEAIAKTSNLSIKEVEDILRGNS